MKALNSPRVALVVIALVFILPLVMAWLMFTGVIEYRPAATRNLGHLVEPPIAVSWQGVTAPGRSTAAIDGFADHWLVLYALPARCDDPCLDAVVGIRQVHRAAGRHRARIRTALLVDGPDPNELDRLRAIYDGFELIENIGGELWDTLDRAAGQALQSAGAAGGTFLIDPLGNIMMYYPPESDANDLRQDLRRLLTWSKMDRQP